ncbi:MAG TPA: hypothetical protein VGM94_00635 [Galbitalea sp.]|jgi:hypothetical protein
MPTHRAKKTYLPPKTDGLFTVRDSLKDGGKVWGHNLSYTDATKLKEEVTGSRRSRSARLEPQEGMAATFLGEFGDGTHRSESPRTSAPTKPMYGGGGGGTGGIADLKVGETTLELAKQAALRAAAPIAAAAQARASAQRPAPLPPPDAVDIDIPDGDNEYLDDDDIAGLLGEVGGSATSEDIKRAHAQAESDWKASDAKMRDLERKRMPIPDELVAYVGRVPEGYAKGDGGLWSPSAPAPQAA